MARNINQTTIPTTLFPVTSAMLSQGFYSPATSSWQKMTFAFGLGYSYPLGTVGTPIVCTVLTPPLINLTGPGGTKFNSPTIIPLNIIGNYGYVVPGTVTVDANNIALLSASGPPTGVAKTASLFLDMVWTSPNYISSTIAAVAGAPSLLPVFTSAVPFWIESTFLNDSGLKGNHTDKTGWVQLDEAIRNSLSPSTILNTGNITSVEQSTQGCIMIRMFSTDNGATWFRYTDFAWFGASLPSAYNNMMAIPTNLYLEFDIALIPGFGYFSTQNSVSLGMLPIYSYMETIGNDPNVYALCYGNTFSATTNILKINDAANSNTTYPVVTKMQNMGTNWPPATGTITESQLGLPVIQIGQACGIPYYGWFDQQYQTLYGADITPNISSVATKAANSDLFMLPFLIAINQIGFWIGDLFPGTQVIVKDPSILCHLNGYTFIPGTGWTGDTNLMSLGFSSYTNPNLSDYQNSLDTRFIAGIIAKIDGSQTGKTVYKLKLIFHQGNAPNLTYTGNLQDSSKLQVLYEQWVLLPTYGFVRPQALPYYGYIPLNENSYNYCSEHVDTEIYAYLCIEHKKCNITGITGMNKLGLPKNPYYQPSNISNPILTCSDLFFMKPNIDIDCKTNKLEENNFISSESHRSSKLSSRKCSQISRRKDASASSSDEDEKELNNRCEESDSSEDEKQQQVASKNQ